MLDNVKHTTTILGREAAHYEQCAKRKRKLASELRKARQLIMRNVTPCEFEHLAERVHACVYDPHGESSEVIAASDRALYNVLLTFANHQRGNATLRELCAAMDEYKLG